MIDEATYKANVIRIEEMVLIARERPMTDEELQEALKIINDNTVFEEQKELNKKNQ